MNDIEILDFMERTLDVEVVNISKFRIDFFTYTSSGVRVNGEILMSKSGEITKQEIIACVIDAAYSAGYMNGKQNQIMKFREVLDL